MSEPFLKPCPFCGNADVQIHHGHSGSMQTFAVYCDAGCYLRTQDYINAEVAMQVWNTRTDSPADVVIDRLRTAAAEAIAAFINYKRCHDATNLSPYVRSNGRHGLTSPWAELANSISMLGESIRADLPHDACEHSVRAGDWCEPCNKEYKDADLLHAEHPSGGAS